MTHAADPIEPRDPAQGYSVNKIAKAESTVSPKVTAGALVGVVLTVLVAVIAAVTPDMLAGLGAWGVLIFAGLVALGQAITAYLKRDPLREQ